VVAALIFLALWQGPGLLSVSDGPADPGASSGSAERTRGTDPVSGLSWVDAGSLPPELREQYALPWNGEDDESYGRWSAAIRRFRRRMPDRMARWASARPVTA